MARLDRDTLILRSAWEQTHEEFMLLKDLAASWQPGPMPSEWGKYQPTRHPRRMRS